jgi:DNA recombination protein Rad52
MDKTNTLKKLREKIKPELVKTREGAGKKILSYIEGWKAEENANEIFDFDWDKKTISVDELYKREYEVEDKYKKGQMKEMLEVAYKSTVEVVIRFDDKEITRQGTGFGNGQASTKSPSSCYELAIKEAETDACKRALKSLGAQFGIDLYDKTYNPDSAYKEDYLTNKDVLIAVKELKECKTDEEVVKVVEDYEGAYREEVITQATLKRRELKEDIDGNS